MEYIWTYMTYITQLYKYITMDSGSSPIPGPNPGSSILARTWSRRLLPGRRPATDMFPAFKRDNNHNTTLS